MGSNKKVTYYYDPDIGQYYYGQGHPMKPHRVRMAHSLILHYGLYEQMECYRPAKATEQDMTAFHSADYVHFLATITPERLAESEKQLAEWNMLEQDCPAFPGLWPYCQTYTGGSLGAAVKLNYNDADIAINWAGGLHHAKKSEASGFCYINDIVLAILELLKYHQRVLYLDIDVHHGDGVEEAFSTTDRVMTVSFHKFGGGFFPGTGDIINIGHGKGKNYSLNVPLRDGITDDAYHSLFKPVMAKVMEMYRPEAVVLQCGADSLAGDRLGVFNLSSKGHAACVEYMKSFNVPLMLLGGGGYKITNVSRCWAYETGVALGADMTEALPPNEYYETYSASGYNLTVKPKDTLVDQNSKEYLEQLQIQIMSYLKHVNPVPSVPFHERPPDGMDIDDLELVDMSGEGHGDDEERPRLWNDRGDGEGSGGSEAGRSRPDISHKEEDAADGPQLHHRSPQMWRSNSLKSPLHNKPSMLGNNNSNASKGLQFGDAPVNGEEVKEEPEKDDDEQLETEADEGSS